MGKAVDSKTACPHGWKMTEECLQCGRTVEFAKLTNTIYVKTQSRLSPLWNNFEDWFMNYIVDDIYLHIKRLLLGSAIVGGFVLVGWTLLNAPAWTIGFVVIFITVYGLGWLLGDL